ncbi:uncharacterized protein LOC128261583 [Drosophila gunungcola]|uniref:Uncharacterized protein n=1 Tax=Drosophila gunungcola TaxID=103775 RepID=A0A9Q0BTK6_9MUSC|nr:uncharacterized protein LOC128261583 [Drosophila gunungcola]KAI8043324.1 hypothetical protein M5D96_004653 [Drosophila gunungcola]
MSRVQKSAGSQHSPGGMVSYGSGIVFGGNVYPVLVDGVPMQPPMGAHQAAAQQRLQMQQRPMQIPPQKPIVSQRAHPTSHAPAGTYMTKQVQQSPLCHPGDVRMQQQQYHNFAMMQQLQVQLLQQRQQMQMAMGHPYSHYGQYNLQLQRNAGGDSGGWNGYAMMQPSDVNKPYSFSD